MKGSPRRSDRFNVGIFESLARRVTNDRRGIGAMRFDEEDWVRHALVGFGTII
jgi:phosphate starvation-inducible protein PhoH